MTDIYQEIWNADQGHAGLKPILAGTPIDQSLHDHGYILVDKSSNAGANHRLIREIHIPAAKLNSYRRVKWLFNNYTLDQTKPEINLDEEKKEVQDFINEIYQSPPMNVARQHYEARSGRALTDDQWWAIIQRIWFEQFNQGTRNRDLSGFEHVIVGEQKQGAVQGYHFWYKYFLDERFRRDDSQDPETDLIKFLTWRNPDSDRVPEVATLSYEWRAFDYEREEFRKLVKPIGGFWIGPSVEGLMAMGTLCFLPEANAPKTTTINGSTYRLKLFKSDNKRNLRTFYPEFAS